MTAASTGLRSAPPRERGSDDRELLEGFGTALEGVGAKRHEAHSVLASVSFADADSLMLRVRKRSPVAGCFRPTISRSPASAMRAVPLATELEINPRWGVSPGRAAVRAKTPTRLRPILPRRRWALGNACQAPARCDRPARQGNAAASGAPLPGPYQVAWLGQVRSTAGAASWPQAASRVSLTSLGS